MAAGRTRRFFSRLGTIIEGTRRFVLNAVFLIVLLVVIATLFAGRPEVPERAALVLDPRGVVVDQLTAVDPFTRLVAQGEIRETLLSDMIRAVDRASKDARIPLLVISLNDLDHIGISKSLELANAIKRFRESGKPVMAVADSYDQDRYFLAMHANEVYLSPMGAVAIEGFGLYRNYFQRALDKLAVNFHVFRVGEFKSAMEPFTRDSMSEEDREASLAWLRQLWALYVDQVQTTRGIKRGDFSRYVNHIDQALAEHRGDAAEAARAAGLVDGALSRRELRDMLIERVGENPDRDFNQINFSEYLARTKTHKSNRDRVGIIVASGIMLDGEQPSGTIGGDTLAGIIRDAREDRRVKAVVLRIDSGGGSAFAAEIIRSELQALKEAGKPLVVSMGSTAASGGYWIAADADEIWVTPATLTGSIGIFGAFPTLEDSLDKLGISTDGVGTTDVAGALRIDRPLNPVVARALQSGIEHGYRQFLGIVANGRGMLMEQVEQVAEGRVWTGQDAVQLGLADKLGSLEDAVKSAVELAGLEQYEVDWLRPPQSPLEEIFQRLTEDSAVRLPAFGTALHGSLRPLVQQVQGVTRLNDPRGMYALCSACLAP